MPAAREIRVAAMADLHFDGSDRGAMKDVFTGLRRDADFLTLCGDLTTNGRPEEMRPLAAELAAVDIPTVAVLGNHDHESGAADELSAMLKDVGVHVLDGDHITLQGVGFVGTKGFGGGFGRDSLAPFGERSIKDFVQVAVDEELKLETGLRNLSADTKVVVLHYAPIAGTCAGEPEPIYPFLGCSRLAQPLDTYGASVIFHGHAHHGTTEGRTRGGAPVYNVSRPLLREQDREFLLWTAEAPERRQSVS